MRIAVCIKQVPDSEARLRIAADGKWIEEDDIQFVINESDEYALEEGLQLAEQTGGEVVVYSLGPERVREALRKALALGASRAVHLSDDAFLGGDALATGRALAAAIAKEDYDLVLTGSQSDDQGYGSTGSILAGYLGWPHAWLVMGVEIEPGGGAKVVREMEAGMNEIFKVPDPRCSGDPGRDQQASVRLPQGHHASEAQGDRAAHTGGSRAGGLRGG